MGARTTELRHVELERFFRPRSVLVIGASESAGKPAAALTRKLVAWAEARGAAIHLVNPNRDTILDRPSYRAIADVPDPVDVAVILTNDVLAALGELDAIEPAFAVAFAAGFAEVGSDGEAKQRELAALVDCSPTHLLGPNTNANAFELFRDDLDGKRIALITQSGHQGRPIFQAQDLGIALGYWAPCGNEVDLEFADFAAWFADQPEVGVVAAYVEGFKDGRTFQLAADHCAQAGVPIVLVKVGRTEAGRSMAKSHTGHLTGSDSVTSAVFRQFGVTRVQGLDELQDTAAMLARSGPPTAGGGVCVYSISGGTGAHMADLVAGAGLPLPDLTPATQAALHEWIPTYLRVSNPVDNGGPPTSDWRGRKILDAIVADPNVAVVVVPITGALESMSMPFARDLVAVAETTDKPICVIWGSPIGTEEAHTVLRSSARLVTFRTFGNCVGAVRAWFDWHEFRSRHRSPFTRRTRTRRPAFDLPARGGTLTEHESKQLLAAYGIPCTREEIALKASEAVKVAAAIGYPVVLKASGAHLAHKSELGLVRLGLRTPAEVKRAYAELAEHSGGEVLVAEQVSGGVECVLGVSHDELFGPTVLFGLGGVLVEVFEDVALRVPPFDKAEARRMVDEVRASALLRGVRGRPAADVPALVDAVMAVQRLAVDLDGVLTELDVNPLVVRPRGQGVVALDALAVLG